MNSKDLALEFIDKIKYCRFHHTNIDESQKGMNFILTYLHNNCEKTAGDIAKALGCSTARVAVLLKKLLEKGYIIKEKGDDARVTIVKITPLGDDYIRGQLDNIVYRLTEIIDYVGADEFDSFSRTLFKIAKFKGEDRKC